MRLCVSQSGRWWLAVGLAAAAAASMLAASAAPTAVAGQRLDHQGAASSKGTHVSGATVATDELDDLDEPQEVDLTYTCVGAYEVTVPAGTFETVLFSWRYDGKVGPARVKDDQYWFFADGLGPVARINMKDISAMLVYRDTSKVAGVLVERR